MKVLASHRTGIRRRSAAARRDRNTACAGDQHGPQEQNELMVCLHTLPPNSVEF
jgi:hypothetical protein